MTNWCHVQDGKVVWGPGGLPRTYENTSNFHLLSEAELRARGWLPHRFVATATEGQIITGSTTEILADEVVETQTARDPTPEEITEQNRVQVPEEVALWQFRAALKLTNNFDRVQYGLAQLSSPEVIIAAELFEYGNKISRHCELVQAVAALTNASQEELDALFIRAASVKS